MKKILVLVLFCSVLIMSCKKVMDDNASPEEIKNNQNEIVDQAIDDLIYGNITADEALNILTKAIEQNKGNGIEWLYVERGKIKRDLQDFEGALEDMNKGLEIKPEAWMYVERGGLKIKLQDFEGALEDMNKGLEMAPKGWMYLMRGRLKINLQDFEGALKDFDGALALGQKGWTHNKEGDRAKIQLKDLKDIADIYINRGICKSELGDLKGALEDMNKALGLGTEPWMYAEKEGKKIELKDLKDDNIRQLAYAEIEKIKGRLKD